MRCHCQDISKSALTCPMHGEMMRAASAAQKAKDEARAARRKNDGS